MKSKNKIVIQKLTHFEIIWQRCSWTKVTEHLSIGGILYVQKIMLITIDGLCIAHGSLCSPLAGVSNPNDISANSKTQC